MEFLHYYNSPLEWIVMISNGTALTRLWFESQLTPYFVSDCIEEKQLPVFDLTDKWLDIYFSGMNPDFIPPVELNTTEFRKLICSLMLKIPYGKTTTYGELAKQAADILGIKHMSAQAVGGAVGHNPISIIIPCHRVIGSNGSMTGYGGGIDKKIQLLQLEKAI